MKPKEPYDGYKEDMKEIKNYFMYMRMIMTGGGKPELVRSFANYIREFNKWKEEEE